MNYLICDKQPFYHDGWRINCWLTVLSIIFVTSHWYNETLVRPSHTTCKFYFKSMKEWKKALWEPAHARDKTSLLKKISENDASMKAQAQTLKSHFVCFLVCWGRHINKSRLRPHTKPKWEKESSCYCRSSWFYMWRWGMTPGRKGHEAPIAPTSLLKKELQQLSQEF